MKQTKATDDGRTTSPTPCRIWIAPSFRGLMQRSRLDDFDSLMETTDGHLMRRLDHRENWRLDLVDPNGQPRRAYLKKHRLRSFGTRIRALLGLGPGETPGKVEADRIQELNRQGIPTMSLIAFGEQIDGGGRALSFLLTEELTGFTQLDHFLDERFPGRTPLKNPHLNVLIDRIAAIAARFHQLGYNHRDFYTCHFFIREQKRGDFDVNLIDLQRVQRRRRFRWRWIVKDLAQLAYSAPERLIGRRERMRFIKKYLGVRKLGDEDKRLIRAVLRKERWMKHKIGPYRCALD